MTGLYDPDPDRARIKHRIAGRQMAIDMLDLEDTSKWSREFREAFAEYVSSIFIEPEPESANRKEPPIEQLREISMPFGKHAGETLRNVPLSYLEWLVRENEEFYGQLRAYLRHPDTRVRMAAEGIGED